MAETKIKLIGIEDEVVVTISTDAVDKIRLVKGVSLTIDKTTPKNEYKLSFSGGTYTGQPKDFANLYLKIQAIADLYEEV